MRCLILGAVLAACGPSSVPSCPAGEVAFGSDCFSVCNTSIDCPADQHCENGVCSPGATGGDGDLLAGDDDLLEGDGDAACDSPADCTTPAGPASCVTGTACTLGACVYTYDANAVCAGPTCASSLVTTWRCGSAGACDQDESTGCAGYACQSATACRVACGGPSDCAPGYSCHLGSGECQPTSVAPSLATSTLTATPDSGLSNDGVTTSTLDIVIKDASGTALAGIVPVVSVSGTGNVFVQPGATNALGHTSVTLASTTGGTKTVSLASPAELTTLSVEVRFDSLRFVVSDSNHSPPVDFDFGAGFDTMTNCMNHLYTLWNNGETSTSVIDLSVTHDDPVSAWAVSGGCDGAALVPNGHCTFYLTYCPATYLLGNGLQEVTVTASADDGGVATTAASATNALLWEDEQFHVADSTACGSAPSSGAPTPGTVCSSAYESFSLMADASPGGVQYYYTHDADSTYCGGQYTMATNHVVGPYLRDCDTQTQRTTAAPWARWMSCQASNAPFWGSVGLTIVPNTCSDQGMFPCIVHLYQCR